ncbi:MULTISPECIES: entericidin A/B family lipoprotein [Sphingobium]
MSHYIRFAILLGGLAVASCNTVEGAGKDAQSAGRAVEQTAQDAK